MRVGDSGGAPQDPHAGPVTRRRSRRCAEPSGPGTLAVFWHICPLMSRILLVGYPLLLIVGFFLKFFTIGEALQLFSLALSGALFLTWLAPRRPEARPGRGARNRRSRRVEQPVPAAEVTDGVTDAGDHTTMWAGSVTPSATPAAGSPEPTTVWGALQEPSNALREEAGPTSGLFPDRSTTAGPFTEPGGFSQADLFSDRDGRPLPGSYGDLDSDWGTGSPRDAAPGQDTGPYGEQGGRSALNDALDEPGPAVDGTPGRRPRHR
jgi:hypothetical protein